MAEIQVRAAEPADYDRIVAVMDGWWGRPVAAGLPRLFLDHFAGTSLVAETGDAATSELAGFVAGFLSQALPGEAYIHYAGVAPRFRRAGLARRLYEEFFALARAAGRRTVRAITSPDNSASIAFHTSMGFTVSGPVRDYDGRGRDRVRFERRL
jgi:ribosomal protein S18 acetylase RimI-like enzyme